MGEILRELVDEAGIGQSARWGGEEFMALLTSCSIEDAREVANAIRVRFSRTNFMHSGLHTLSAGVAKPLQGESVDFVCQRVDKALYAAKKNGRNCVVVA